MSSGPDAKRFCFLTVRFCLNIYIKSMLNASIFSVTKCVDMYHINAFCIIFFLCKMHRHCQRILLQKKSKCYNCNIGAKCVVTPHIEDTPVERHHVTLPSRGLGRSLTFLGETKRVTESFEVIGWSRVIRGQPFRGHGGHLGAMVAILMASFTL